MRTTRDMLKFGAGCLALGVMLAGCMVGPDYHEPKLATPKTWSETPAGGATAQSIQLTNWWASFHDATLDSLIVRAVQSNLDLRVAAARVREARALRGLVGTDFLPTGHGDASYIDARRSQNAQVFQANQLDSGTYDAHFDAVWELDVFGGKRRAYEAATADVGAAVAGERDVLVSVLAEVARNYIEVRSFQRRLAITHDNLVAQQDAVTIATDRFKAGLTGELDVAQAKTLLAATQSQVPALESLLRQAIHRLGVLLGKPPGALLAELEVVAPIPVWPPTVPVGMPSDLLRRRPDVRRAERQLAAMTARVGQGTAELFPKFSLLGTAGFQSLSAGDWFSSGSRFWAAGPMVTWRLFEFPKIKAGLRAANAQEDQFLATYEQTVLVALEEVENALVAFAKEQQRRDSLAQAAESSRRSVDLANQLYTKGLSDFLNVVTAQRALFESEDALVRSEQGVSQNLVALYKSLGGGWEVFEPPPAATAKGGTK